MAISAQHGLPVHYACKNGCDLEVIQYLAREFPESLAEHVDTIGSPLHCAIDRDNDDPHTFDQERYDRYRAIFDFLLHERYKASIESGTPRLHALLLDDEICDKDAIISQFTYKDMKTEDQLGRWPVHLVFGATRNYEILEKMLDYTRHSFSRQDSKGWLPLHYAMRHNASADITSYIMQQHPEHVLEADHQGATPFHVACQYGCALETIQILLDDNQDLITVQDSLGRYPLHLACEGGASVEVVDYLFARQFVNGMALQDLVEMRDSEEKTLLHAACKGSASIRVIHYLIVRGVQFGFTLQRFIGLVDIQGRTPLHAACEGSAPLDVVRYLVESSEGALAVQDNNGDLPLHKACRVGNFPLIEYLTAKDGGSALSRNHSNELPVSVLCNPSGKDSETLESTEYVHAIFQLLVEFPETVDQIMR